MRSVAAIDVGLSGHAKAWWRGPAGEAKWRRSSNVVGYDDSYLSWFRDMKKSGVTALRLVGCRSDAFRDMGLEILPRGHDLVTDELVCQARGAYELAGGEGKLGDRPTIVAGLGTGFSYVLTIRGQIVHKFMGNPRGGAELLANGLRDKDPRCLSLMQSEAVSASTVDVLMKDILPELEHELSGNYPAAHFGRLNDRSRLDDVANSRIMSQISTIVQDVLLRIESRNVVQYEIRDAIFVGSVGESFPAIWPVLSSTLGLVLSGFTVHFPKHASLATACGAWHIENDKNKE